VRAGELVRLGGAAFTAGGVNAASPASLADYPAPAGYCHSFGPRRYAAARRATPTSELRDPTLVTKSFELRWKRDEHAGRTRLPNEMAILQVFCLRRLGHGIGAILLALVL